jgi:hypothetical protein
MSNGWRYVAVSCPSRQLQFETTKSRSGAEGGGAAQPQDLAQEVTTVRVVLDDNTVPAEEHPRKGQPCGA